MSKLNLPRGDLIVNRAEMLTKLRTLRLNFRNREGQIKTDLEKASRIWKKLGDRFRWWGSLP